MEPDCREISYLRGRGMLHIATIVGARPQFIKAAVLSEQFKKRGIKETLIHTGQHYDTNMSDIFFRELGLDRPQLNLGIHGDTNTAQTAKTMLALERQMPELRPDAILVYGDTNATLSGALTGAQMQIPIIHVEAGLRSYDRRMPEELNRVLADSLSRILFCPTDAAVENLKKEGIVDGVYNVGDIMYDAVLRYSGASRLQSGILDRLRVREKEYVLATVHRNFNTDDPARLRMILESLVHCGETVVLPLHPRTKKMIGEYHLESYLNGANLVVTEPLGYLDMIRLQTSARVIVTDSGGVQKEAYYNGVPSVVLRDNTEWVELIEMGWGQLVPAQPDAVIPAIRSAKTGRMNRYPYGRGNTGELICDRILDVF